MSKSGKSKSALKRVAKEKELLLSSWKLADQMYSELWGPARWETLKAALGRERQMCKCRFGKRMEGENLREIGRFTFEQVGAAEEVQKPFFKVDQEAFFLFDILAPSKDDTVLGKSVPVPVKIQNFPRYVRLSGIQLAFILQRDGGKVFPHRQRIQPEQTSKD